MVVEKCPFDPLKDLKPVEQYGFIDLKNALDSSIVPSQMPESDSDYNGIDDPDKVLGKPSDVFEAIDAQQDLETVASASGDSDDD